MHNLNESSVLNTLRALKPPGSDKDIVALNMVSGLDVQNTPDGAKVRFAIEVGPEEGEAMEPLRKEAEEAVKKLPGVASVAAILTAHRHAPPISQKQPKPETRIDLGGVKHIVAVASGKGGVGKSTVAVNLAVAFARDGLKTGLLDADIYGPSVPRLMGVPEGKPGMNAEGELLPVMQHGVAVMSIGFMIKEDTPMIWRGPMVHRALQQLLGDVAWGVLDVLVIDMPPGTGDAQLTIVQQTSLSGAIIVSTPQDIALLDARKGINMFLKAHVPVLGLIENMSAFVCPHCGQTSHIFGHGGAKAEAEKLGVPFLGEIPLDVAVRETSDAGRPIVAAKTESPPAKAYRRMAGAITTALQGQNPDGQGR